MSDAVSTATKPDDSPPPADRAHERERDVRAEHPYQPAAIEPKWQRVWEEQRTFRAVRRPGHPKMYVLDMFPYPSGTGLHVGHPEGYTATDIISRYKRMRGVDVLHPMGWDAFGLPAEQHAIKTGTHPRTTTLKNIDNFRRQLKMLGFSYDWEREVDTTDPGYVKWTQWIFLQLFERGLAFQQSNMPVNWCPQLGTVLANDEVTPDGRSEVGGFPVEKLRIRQWSLRITEYADRLLAGLEGLDWPETKAKQAHWIGRSEGANVEFAVDGHPGETITVFTTRVDTLAGATYVVLAPEHALAQTISAPDHRIAVKTYADIANAKSDIVRSDAGREKTGVPTGAFAINPVNGEKVPVFVADYVIGSYGTGAVMAVPAHDERDHAFAVKYGLPIIRVVDPDPHAKPGAKPVDIEKEAFTDDGVASEAAVTRSHAPITKGMPSEQVRRAVTDWLAAKGQGSSKITYKLRDWVFSRQRYWGEPIPIYFPVDVATDAANPTGDPRMPGANVTIHYEQPIPLEESELPLVLPDLEDFKPGTDPAGPLARAVDWRFFQKEGKWYARETNTMPQWAGSCWYYLRYLDPKNAASGWTSEDYDAWMPVDLYVGGSEHAVLHLLYARFWHKVLFDMGLVKTDEPFTKLVHQGLILGTSYRYFRTLTTDPADRRLIPGTAKVLRPTDPPEIRLADTNELVEEQWAREDEVELHDNKMFHKDLGVEVVMVAEKMSKSRGNVVNPDDIVKSHGADALRLYEMFMGPLEAVKPWQTSAIEGVRRFLDRTWNVCTNVTDDAPSAETKRLVHKTIKKVTEDIDHMRFNTAISAMMILVKHLGALKHTPRESAKALALLVSPFAPHIGEELWQRLGAKELLAYEPWPAFDADLVKDDVVEIGVQVNGKARASVQIAVDADEESAKAAALADPKIQSFTTGKTIKKVIYVKGRILNLIVA
ncbi:MAG: Leucyl-tRNA synthetase [Myxococcaceae bacterium]|nr:Leucyl-tRNA synthetase [Myxococcaceae bacterium]